eukprot:scaffold117865_cov26-Tisochrysis_lutea.AAC.1
MQVRVGKSTTSMIRELQKDTDSSGPSRRRKPKPMQAAQSHRTKGERTSMRLFSTCCLSLSCWLQHTISGSSGSHGTGCPHLEARVYGRAQTLRCDGVTATL